MRAQILKFPDQPIPLRQLETELFPLIEGAEAMLAQAEMNAAAGQPSLSDAECRDIALDVSLQAYATCDRLGLCPLVDMMPFWMKAAVRFPRVSEGVRRVWERERSAEATA